MSEVLFPIPEHWESTTLGEVCKRGGGDVQTGPFGSLLHASDYVADGIPSIMPQNIGDNRISEKGIARINDADAQRLSRYLVRAGDIVYSRRGDVERRALIRERETGWLCGTGCLRVRFGEGVIHPPYAAFYLGHPIVRKWIVRHAQGATMPNLNTAILSALPFVRPPLEEQRAIAQILGSLDDKIEINHRINETLEAMARTIFQSWFVDFDPVRAKVRGEPAESICRRFGLTTELLALFPNGLVETEMGPIPEGWAIEILGDLCDRVAMGPFGSDIKTDNFVSEGVPVIRGGNLKNGFGGGDFVFLTAAKADELRNANAFPGDIVLTHRGTLGQVGLIPADAKFPRYVISQSQMLLSVKKSRTTARYVYEYLRSPQGQHAVLSNTSQVGVPAISRPTTSLKAIRILNPSMPILKAYNAMTDAFFAAMTANNKATDSISVIRDSLLPQLLKGNLLLSNVEGLS